MLQPFDPAGLLYLALLNPVVAIAAFMLGRRADQPQKILIAALIASILGSVAVWLAAWLHLITARGSGGEGGIFILQCLAGLVWAGIGYYARPRSGT